jgi:hypothetical protein
VFKQYSYDGFKDNSAQNYARQLTSGVDETGRLAGIDRSDASVSLRSERSIELPFPKQLTESISPIINTMSRDPLVEQGIDALSSFMNGGGGTLSSIPGQLQNLGIEASKLLSGGGGLGGVGASINRIAESIGGVGTDQAAAMASYLARGVINALPGDIGKNINLATGNIINPRETLSFEGVGLRQHSFNWDLYPSNVNDSKRIQEIISIMKRSILPTTKGIKVGDFEMGKVFLQYPHVLEMYLIGVRDGYFMKFKPCFVTGMTVDYGAGGTLGIMKGGRPAGVNIQLSMQELQIETAHDYGEAETTSDEGQFMAADPVDPNQTGPQ